MKIDDSDLQRIDKPTKTFFSTLAYTQGNIFEGFLATESDYTQYLNYQLKDETTEIQQNMDGLFGVLISNQLNSINIELPLVPELVSSFFEFEWDISY
jgi:hypothetical protein